MNPISINPTASHTVSINKASLPKAALPSTASHLRPLFFALLILLLAGCVNQPSRIPMGNWDERQALLETFDHWQISGKLGVRVPKDSGSANLRWQQTQREYTLDLSGPLGSGRALITGKPGHVSLQQPGQPNLTAKTPEELILQSTGWQIPVTQLTFWVRALPNPKQPITHWEKNELNQLTRLEQDGWRIQYSQYQTIISTTGEQTLLPGRVVAEYNDARLTLVIREWQLDKASKP
jgi:outer membrane lipoprotein LolB